MLRGRHLRVEVEPASVTYIIDGDGPPLQITHHGTPVSVTPDQPVTRDIPGLLARPLPSQPPGREPVHRGAREPGRAGPAGSQPAGSRPADSQPTESQPAGSQAAQSQRAEPGPVAVPDGKVSRRPAERRSAGH